MREIPGRAFEGGILAKRGRGRPKVTFIKQVYRDDWLIWNYRAAGDRHSGDDLSGCCMTSQEMKCWAMVI